MPHEKMEGVELSSEAKVLEGLYRNYGISEEEMAQMLGFGRGPGPAEAVASFRSGRTGMGDELRKRVKVLSAIFGVIATVVTQQEDVREFITKVKFDGKTIMEMLLRGDEEELDIFQRRHLARLTGASYKDGKLTIAEI